MNDTSMKRAERRRPSGTLFAALVCTVTLGACMDESCNPVAPDELIGSHETGESATIDVEIDYLDEGIANTAPVVNGFIGRVPYRVSKGGSTRIFVTVRKNGFIGTSVENDTGESCSWKGKKSLFAADVGYVISADSQVSNRFYGRCAGW